MPHFILTVALFALFIIESTAQSIIVNPDGTHSIIVGTGNIKTVVNPSGGHTTLIDHGVHKIVVHPNGTHTTVVDHGNSRVFVGSGSRYSLFQTTDNHQSEQRASHSLLNLLSLLNGADDDTRDQEQFSGFYPEKYLIQPKNRLVERLRMRKNQKRIWE